MISTGIPDLDAMFAPGGPFRGSATMISGGSGTGKTTCSAAIADAACARGETTLYCASEESRARIVRNHCAQRLVDTVRVCEARPLARFCDDLITAMFARTRQTDDMALLAIDVGPAGGTSGSRG